MANKNQRLQETYQVSSLILGIIGRDIKDLISEAIILFLLEFEKCYKIAIIPTNQQVGGTFTRALGRNLQHILRDD
jgi:hypothetical protein